MTVRKVLCADESSADLKALGRILSAESINVVYAISGKEAIHYAKVELPDLIFLDILLPDMSGFSVLRELQKFPFTRDIPVVFVSSKSQKAEQAWAKLQGGKGFVAKPVNAKTVLAAISKF